MVGHDRCEADWGNWRAALLSTLLELICARVAVFHLWVRLMCDFQNSAIR
jgi:hypothetical protein